MLRGIYMYQRASGIDMVTMCASPLSQHVSSNWKFVFHCLEKLHVLISQVMNQISNPKIYVSHLSYITATNNVDTDINNDENSQSFVTPRRTIPVPLNPMMWIIQQFLFIINLIPVNSNRVLQINNYHWNSFHLGDSIYFSNLW